MAKTTGVKSLREASGLNQNKFWPPLGVTQSGGSRYESGRTRPKPLKILMQIVFSDKTTSQLIVRSLRKKFGKMV